MNNKSSTEFVKLTKAETRKLSPIAKRDYQRKLKNVNQRIRRAKANAAKMNFNDNNGAPPAMANSKGTVKRSVRKQAPTSIATSNGTVKRSVRKQAPPAPSRVVLEAFKINRINNDGVTETPLFHGELDAMLERSNRRCLQAMAEYAIIVSAAKGSILPDEYNGFLDRSHRRLLDMYAEAATFFSMLRKAGQSAIIDKNDTLIADILVRLIESERDFIANVMRLFGFRI